MALPKIQTVRHPVRESLATCVKDWRIAFSFGCFLGKHQPGLNIRLKADVGEDEIDPFSAFKERKGLLGGIGRKRCVASVLKYPFCENSDLFLVLHYQHNSHETLGQLEAESLKYWRNDISHPLSTMSFCILPTHT